MGILAAFREVERAGRGLIVRAGLLETDVVWMTVFVASHHAHGALTKMFRSAMPAPCELFAIHDGLVFIAAGNDRLLLLVCKGLSDIDACVDRLIHISCSAPSLVNTKCVRSTIRDAESRTRARKRLRLHSGESTNEV